MWSSAVLLVFLRLLAVQLVVAMQLVVMQLMTTQQRRRALTHGGGQVTSADNHVPPVLYALSILYMFSPETFYR